MIEWLKQQNEMERTFVLMAGPVDYDMTMT